MARVTVRETTIRSEEMALPAYASDVLTEEDHGGHPHVRGAGTIILPDGGSVSIRLTGDRPYGGHQSDEFTSVGLTVRYEKLAIAEAAFGSEPADREAFEEVLAVLEGLVAKVRAGMGEA